jgi:hypothetical protein
MMKDSNNEIALDFTLEGDLKNPKFNLQDRLVQKIALSLAKTLGLPIENIGESLFEFGGKHCKIFSSNPFLKKQLGVLHF